MTSLNPPAPRPLGFFSQTPPIKVTHVLLIGIIILASFTRIWRLGEPDTCYFDEVYFPTNAALILNGEKSAWDFYGTENTHPPLSKLLMAAGEGIFGTKSYNGGTNSCWPDTEDEGRRNDPNWLYDPFGFRFPGALAGVFSVIFMYLLARALFKNEVAALASAFLLTIDGLVLTQSRIATPDTYVLFFVLASVYFLVTRRWLLSGVFIGAASSAKWIGAFTIGPIIIWYFWTAYLRWKAAEKDPRLREAERVLLVGGFFALLGLLMAGIIFAFAGLSDVALLVAGAPMLLGIFIIVGGLFAIVTEPTLRSLPRARVYLNTAIGFPLFFILVPGIVYLAAYIPMLLEGQNLAHAWDLNRMAYEFHSSLKSPHAYQSKMWQWPIDARPVYFYLGSGESKIYNLGNPLIFWMSIPALFFIAWQGLRFIRVRVESGGIRIWGNVSDQQFALLFVVVSYLGFWLALSTQGRALFSYHYQEAFAFSVLALGYTVSWLWDHPHPWGRWSAIGFLAAAGVAFVYFFPHWTAIDVARWLDDSYFWFDSWR